MFYDLEPRAHLIMGTARYPSTQALADAVTQAKPDMVTASLRRDAAGSAPFRELLQHLGCPVLPNTAGCHTAREAVTTAQMARELFSTDRIKLEVVGHAGTLQPDPIETVEAARILCAEGFKVFPYTTEDLVICERLVQAGCQVLMPWAAPIGSGQGLRNIEGLQMLRQAFPDVALVVDAGIRSPSQAAQVMELGYDGVLCNTAIASAGDSAAMACAFVDAIDAGRRAFLAGLMPRRDTAQASSPVVGVAALA